jgi:hypothetical protein
VRGSHIGLGKHHAAGTYLTNSRNRVESDAGDVEGAGVPVDKGIKQKPEVSMLEVSAIERERAFMTLRSNKRKYSPNTRTCLSGKIGYSLDTVGPTGRRSPLLAVRSPRPRQS